jgi:hypothetical protein
MRFLPLFLLIPFFSFAQELPADSIAAKTGIKKLVILKSSKKNPIDTAAVYLFDGRWKTKEGTLYNEPGRNNLVFNDEASMVSDDSTGRLIYKLVVTFPMEENPDSVCYRYKFDTNGKLITSSVFTFGCNSKTNEYGESCKQARSYFYNDSGRLILILDSLGFDSASTWFFCPDREEYTYDKAGKLTAATISVISRYTKPGAPCKYIQVCKMKYYYNKDGLISSALLDDVENFSGLNNASEAEEEFLPPMKFTYIYIY